MVFASNPNNRPNFGKLLPGNSNIVGIIISSQFSIKTISKVSGSSRRLLIKIRPHLVNRGRKGVLAVVKIGLLNHRLDENNR